MVSTFLDHGLEVSGYRVYFVYADLQSSFLVWVLTEDKTVYLNDEVIGSYSDWA